MAEQMIDPVRLVGGPGDGHVTEWHPSENTMGIYQDHKGREHIYRRQENTDRAVYQEPLG